MTIIIKPLPHFIKNREVSISISIFLIIIFILYHISILKNLPCGKSIHNVFLTNFVHIEPQHLISNLYSLFALSKVESEIGRIKFIKLIVLLLIFTTILEYIYKNIIHIKECSIGFSGILFGIFTYDLIAKKDVDLYMISSIILMLYVNGGKGVSNIGHIFGIIAGVFSAKILK